MKLELKEDTPYCCTRCGASMALGDAFEEIDYEVVLEEDDLGLPWCQKHLYIKKVVNYGARHNWPEVYCENWKTGRKGEQIPDHFIISEGMTSWLAVMMWCDDDKSFIAEGMVDYLESEEQAS